MMISQRLLWIYQALLVEVLCSDCAEKVKYVSKVKNAINVCKGSFSRRIHV